MLPFVTTPTYQLYKSAFGKLQKIQDKHECSILEVIRYLGTREFIDAEKYSYYIANKAGILNEVSLLNGHIVVKKGDFETLPVQGI